MPSDRVMTEAEWRGLGVMQSRGWVHYAIHKCVGDVVMAASADRMAFTTMSRIKSFSVALHYQLRCVASTSSCLPRPAVWRVLACFETMVPPNPPTRVVIGCATQSGGWLYLRFACHFALCVMPCHGAGK